MKKTTFLRIQVTVYGIAVLLCIARAIKAFVEKDGFFLLASISVTFLLLGILAGNLADRYEHSDR